MLEHPGITTLHLSSEANDYKPPRSLSTQLLHWLTHAPCTSLTLSGVAINLRGQPQVGDAICDAIAASTLCTLRLFSVKHFDAAVLHGRRLPASLESFEWVAPGDEKTLAPATLAHLARALEGAPSLVHLGRSLTYLGQLGSCSWLDPVLARLTSLRALGSYNDASFATVRVMLVNIEKISLRKAATSYTQYTELVGALPQLPRLVELDMRDNTLYREDIGRILAAYEDFFHFVPEIVACTRHLTTLSLTPQHTEKRKDIECKAALLRILTIVEEPMFRLHPDVSANVPRSTLESVRSLMSRTSEDTCLLLF
ncbi:hypothetical protein SDRG_11478 [Saprolegnia diclina VS20]|uniref:Uncharacterized protein n=1 Tax=Saprolegnia diclina (strain VS20) TaxID=1156394 RepID=T0PYT8_SAPDV|nr:hypothetical protein SDRG_11478 [Saprolegnia diclina VS20]EQC30719.1 hypothetical protein SDRG_11478 [Saprolegnia diclina VS20]|eukprot:XP_008615743.1 hypothetical protein SDRG_11478 [Saprolegnia diclina VS20]